MRCLGKIELGSLNHGGRPLARPVRPWLIDLSMLSPYPGLECGDIADFSLAPDWSRWRLGDTPRNAAHRLRWIVIESAGRRLLICDRVILVRVSWRDLDQAGFVRGAPVQIDGREYNCRLMTGGQDFRVADDGYSRGKPDQNEWDRFVVGEEQISGLPQPTSDDLDRVLNEGDRTSPHNQFWNWMGAVSWTATPFARRETARCCRGYASAGFFYLNTFDHRHEDIGWRPVLEQG